MNYQLSRRSFLSTSAAIALTQLLLGCSNTGTISQILFLEDSIPAQLISDFSRTIGKENQVKFKPQTQIYQIFDSLLNWQQSEKTAQQTKGLFDKIFNKSIVNHGLTTLGDFWLQSAIKQNLIQPLSIKDISSWQNLPTKWQQLVRRNPQGKLTANGMIWGAPYRWGSTVIAYRSDKLEQQGINVSDWSDLWQESLRDRISLLDSPREVIGLTLKKLGHSYNTANLDSVPNLETELLALHQQAKLYSLDHYLEPLILGDTWVAVAWSTDILPLLKRYPDLKFIIPQSGASLWADIWVQPQVSKNSTEPTNSNESKAVIESWINFCWQPKAAKQISLFTNGISPILSSLKSEDIPQDLQENVFLNSEILNSSASEFLLPLTSETEQQYRDMWLKIRQSV
ncbi:extracellular solute-binding protein [Pleurocapsa sp. PCC 7319]|uniref:extracellular solute-binding protein n=1 Tax=Pleurocapsa sp. PCC 7319 TaxID=118161 RepID=UPI00034AFE1E|nr:extracellular solute-binding protein [Pleurocapsa sp. PCC 7319]